MSERFLPSIQQFNHALATLPDPDLWPQDEFRAVVKGNSRDGESQEILFRKIKVSRSSGNTSRWVFEGRMMIRNRDIEACRDRYAKTVQSADQAEPEKERGDASSERPRSSRSRSSSRRRSSGER